VAAHETRILRRLRMTRRTQAPERKGPADVQGFELKGTPNVRVSVIAEQVVRRVQAQHSSGQSSRRVPKPTGHQSPTPGPTRAGGKFGYSPNQGQPPKGPTTSRPAPFFLNRLPPKGPTTSRPAPFFTNRLPPKGHATLDPAPIFLKLYLEAAPCLVRQQDGLSYFTHGLARVHAQALDAPECFSLFQVLAVHQHTLGALD